MSKLKLTIIIDTNIWISYLLGGKSFEYLKRILLDKHITILMSDELKAEILEVISRKKFDKLITSQQKEDFQYIISYKTTNIKVISKVAKCKDVKDNFLLALCKDGKADYLLSGDKDIADMAKYDNCQLITLKKFINSLTI